MKHHLQTVWDFVAAQKQAKVSASMIIDQLIKDYGATVRTSTDPYSLRVGGHVATCTWSCDEGLLANWYRSASLKLIGGGR